MTEDQRNPLPSKDADKIETSSAPVLESQRIDVSEKLPVQIDHYRIIEIVGEGGMGEVYKAEQLEPIRRTVALKLIKRGMDSEQVLSRFELERQSLALMNHANIARIFDGGVSEQGRAYFVMEYVEGIPIDRYCDSHCLKTRQRLELFIQTCKGIQHAHQKGIIHRDIKPSNVLIETQEGKAVPKIIDFGVAKATETGADAETALTQIGQIIGTPRYMSPEQVSGLDIDTRTDVYSLGVLLYELLAGTHPLDTKGGSQRRGGEILRRICEEDPSRPSTQVSTLGETREQVARRHGTNSLLLAKELRGDLDWITMKALEKDRSRRYDTVSSLAKDLERYLAGKPVEAAPPSAVYRLRKFALRHSLGLSMAAILLMLLVAGVVTVAWMAVKARRAEAEAKAVNDFLRNDVLVQASSYQQAGPDTKPDPDLKVRTALDRASDRIEGKFAAQPLLEAAIRSTIGSAYADLSLYSKAEQQYRRALDIRRSMLGEKHLDSLTNMTDLATVLRHKGDFQAAEPLYLKVVETARLVLGAEHGTTLYSMRGLAALYSDQGKYAEAEEKFSQLLEIDRRVIGPEHANTLQDMNNLAGMYHFQAKYEQAEPLYKRALEIMQRILGEEHPITLSTAVNLAELYRDQNKDAQAEPLYLKALETQCRVMGENNQWPIYTMNSLAGLYRKRAQYKQSEELYSRALEAGNQGLGKQHPFRLESMNGLAQTYLGEGKYEKAFALFTDVLELRRSVLGEEHPNTLLAMASLGDVRLRQRKYVEAEAMLRSALKGYEKANTDTWVRYYCQSLLGTSLAGQKKFAEAEPLLLSGYEGMAEREAAIPAGERSALADGGDRIVTLYQDWRKTEKAAEWRKKLQSSER